MPVTQSFKGRRGCVSFLQAIRERGDKWSNIRVWNQKQSESMDLRLMDGDDWGIVGTAFGAASLKGIKRCSAGGG